MILEIGLGGRLDAMNAVDPDVSIVAAIGIDHTAFLGNTREAIALEKAHIYRSGRRPSARTPIRRQRWLATLPKSARSFCSSTAISV